MGCPIPYRQHESFLDGTAWAIRRLISLPRRTIRKILGDLLDCPPIELHRVVDLEPADDDDGDGEPVKGLA